MLSSRRLARTRWVQKAVGILAALVIGLSDGIISVFFSPTLSKILGTLLVALVLVVKPQGLFSGSAR